MTFILPPIGWTTFKLHALDNSKLEEVNTRVNARIIATETAADKPWRIIRGDEQDLEGCCHDFALTKRAELLGLGWPASQLLLCEVLHTSAEDHLVLVVNGCVLDNLRAEIVSWKDSNYVLKGIQSAENPDFWKSSLDSAGEKE
jgi:predicted transglutaminase-like cysteine proteinase